MILTCAVVVIFLATSYFPGLNKMPLFKRRTVSSEIIQLEEPIVLEQAGYAVEDEGVMMKELLHPSVPDLFPTPRRPRRGTSDSTFGTSEIVHLINMQILFHILLTFYFLRLAFMCFVSKQFRSSIQRLNHTYM